MVAAGGVDFVMNAQPSFATAEATIVSAAGKVNMHGLTSNPSVFTAQLPGVFGVAPSSADYTPSLFQAYKVQGLKLVSLRSMLRACMGHGVEGTSGTTWQ